MNKAKRNKIIEYTLLGLFGSLALWGLVYIILGLFAMYLPIPEADNGLRIGSAIIKSKFGLGFFGWGLILFGVFAVCCSLTFIYFAKDVDKDYEKKQRRAARLKRNQVNETPAEVVDVKVE